MSDLVVGSGITGFLFWYLRSVDPVVAPNSETTQCVYFLFIYYFTTKCVLCFMVRLLCWGIFFMLMQMIHCCISASVPGDSKP